jgi:hypothetical protein
MDPANRLYGWKELGREVSAIRGAMASDAFIATRNYGTNAALAFYVDGNPEVYEIPLTRRHSQYDFWNDSIDVEGKDAVFVSRRPIRAAIRDAFAEVELAKEVVIRVAYGDEVRAKYYIYRCRQYKGASSRMTAY